MYDEPLKPNLLHSQCLGLVIENVIKIQNACAVIEKSSLGVKGCAGGNIIEKCHKDSKRLYCN